MRNDPHGTYRRIDSLGRVVIPQDLRDLLHWSTNQSLEILIHDTTTQSIILTPEQTRCSLCNTESHNLTRIEQGYVCGGCLVRMRA